MKLDIDIGNSRAKWRLGDDSVILERGVVASTIEDLKVLLDNLHKGAVLPDTVRVASVKDEEFCQQLQLLCEEHQLKAVFVCASSETLGIKNSYANPAKMGVDRWCALVAAAQVHQQAGEKGQGIIVVDAGSALTLDVVSLAADNRRHVGGYIVPGYRMQLTALLGGTQRISLEDHDNQPGIEPGNDTRSSVCSGVIASLSALVNDTVQRMERHLGCTFTIYLTGGDALRIEPYLQAPVMHQPDLVLAGIALIAESSPCAG